MGFYIQRSDDDSKHKAEWLVDFYEGIVIDRPKSFDSIPKSKALIIVVDNGNFEAAGYIYNENEWNMATQNSKDFRVKTFVLLDKKLAEKISGYAAAMEEEK